MTGFSFVPMQYFYISYVYKGVINLNSIQETWFLFKASIGLSCDALRQASVQRFINISLTGRIPK